MAKKFLFLLLLTALLALAPIHLHTAYAGDDPRAIMEQLEKAGDHAGSVWDGLSPAQQDAVLQYLQPDFYKQGKRGKIERVIFVPATDTSKPRESKQAKGSPSQTGMQPMWGSAYYYIVNNTYCCIDDYYATSVSGYGPGTLTLDITQSVSNQWSANVGVSADVVSAGVGFDVTHSQSYHYSYSTTLNAGEHKQINAYNRYYHYNYEVWYNPTFGDAYHAGDGNADNFMGVEYVLFTL